MKQNSIEKNIENEITQNQKSIQYYTAEYTLEVLFHKLNNEDIYIPEYQRKNIWDKKRKCRFIESILIGLPIPFLFFWENPKNGKLEIVDGVQRLTTIREFYKDELLLSNLEKIPSANKIKYSDLLESRKRKFSNTSIRSIMLSDKADSEARFDLFERINTGSKIAEPAELRRGLLQGEFYSLIEELSNYVNFVKLTFNISDQKINEGERNELVSRFFAYSNDIENYKGTVSPFIFSYIEKMNKQEFSVTEYKQAFMNIMDIIYCNDLNAFKGEKGRISRARFESVSIGLYLAIKEDHRVREHITPEVMARLRNNATFNQVVTSDGANTKSKLIKRLEFTKNFFLELIHA